MGLTLTLTLSLCLKSKFGFKFDGALDFGSFSCYIVDNAEC